MHAYKCRPARLDAFAAELLTHVAQCLNVGKKNSLSRSSGLDS